MPRSFQTRLFFSYLLLFSLLAAVFLPLALARVHHSLENEAAHNLRNQATLLAPRLSQLAGGAGSGRRLSAFVNNQASMTGARLLVATADGRVMADSDPLQGGLPARDILLPGAPGDYQLHHNPGLNQDIVCVALPLGVSKKWMLGLAWPLPDCWRLFFDLGQPFLLASLLVLVAGALASWMLAGWQAGSTRRISEAARHIAAGNYSAPGLTGGPQEDWGPAEEAIASMAQGIRRSVENLKSEHTLLGATLEGMDEAVFAIDNQGGVLLVNPACEQIFGIKREQALHRPYYESFRNAELTTLLATARQTGTKTVRGEITLLSPVERVFAVSASTVDAEDPRQRRCVVVLSDITEVKRLVKMRSEFVANVSHELKTPLSAILASLETLEEGALEDPAVNHDFLRKALRQTERLASLIEDVLSLSSIEARQKAGGKSEPASGSLREAFQAAWSLVEKKSQAKELTLRLALPAGVAAVSMEESALVQVFTNFLDNAVKYSPNRGAIQVAGVQTGRRVRVSIADQGPGIPAEHVTRLFERFYRVDKARSRELGGTGLGLSIVKHLVEGAGGAVGVDSLVGRGSTFWFELPAAV